MHFNREYSQWPPQESSYGYSQGIVTNHQSYKPAPLEYLKRGTPPSETQLERSKEHLSVMRKMLFAGLAQDELRGRRRV